MTDHLTEAEHVWHTAHTIYIKEQQGSAQQNGSGGGNGDSKHHLIWVAEVRRLVPSDRLKRALDKRYGCHGEKLEFTREAEWAASGILRDFARALKMKPEVLADYEKMRKICFE